jgi:hypothetical protein
MTGMMSSATAAVFDALCALVAARRREAGLPGILIGQLGDCHGLARMLSGQDQLDDGRVRQLVRRLGLALDDVLHAAGRC